MRIRGSVAVIGFLLAAACSSFNGDTDGTAADAATDGGDDGGGVITGTSPDGSLTLSVTGGKATWVRGRANTVEFTVTRGMGATGRVRVSLKGLSPGGTAPEVLVAAGDTTGKLMFQPSANAPTGDLMLELDAIIDGSSTGAALPLDGFLRGAPGDVDSTFAANGVISIQAKEVSALTSDGHLFVVRADKTTERYTVDGQLDTTFGTNGRGTYSSSSTAAQSPVAIRLSDSDAYTLFTIAGSEGSTSAFLKLSLGGATDTSFGMNLQGYSILSGGQPVSMARSSAGDLAGVGYAPVVGHPPTGRINWTTSSGMSAADVNATGNTITTALTSAAWDASGLLVVGGQSLGRATTGSQNYANLAFPGGHIDFGSTISLFDINLEGSDILVSGIDTSSNAPFMAKLQPNGSPLAGFAFGPAPVTLDAAFATKTYLASDSTILQVGREAGAMTCVVTRYDKTGKSDSTFGANGSARLPITPCQPGSVSVQADGKIIIDAGSLGTAPTVASIVRLWN